MFLFVHLLISFKEETGERKVAYSVILGKAVYFVMLTTSGAWELAPEILILVTCKAMVLRPVIWVCFGVVCMNPEGFFFYFDNSVSD